MAEIPTRRQGESETDPLLPHQRHPWVGWLFGLIALGLVPWTLYLGATLPSRHVQQNFYDVAWVGFDAALAAAIVATAVGVFWRRLWVQGVAACAATLLVTDAWFDVLSSNPGWERTQAILLAVFAELPMAGLCIYMAGHSEQVAEQAQRRARAARTRSADSASR